MLLECFQNAFRKLFPIMGRKYYENARGKKKILKSLRFEEFEV